MKAREPNQWEWGYRIKGGIIRQRVRETLLEQYQDELNAKRLKVEILRFAGPFYQPPLTENQEREITKYAAAQDSTNVKISAFERMGIYVPQREPLPQSTTREEFQALIDQLNADASVNAIIIQYPVPPGLEVVIPSVSQQKDLDALSLPPGFSVPATAEGIFRVVQPFTGAENSLDIQSEAIVRLLEPFATSDVTVAVVGAKGFVGRGVIRLLEEQGISYIAIDRRDQSFQPEDLLRVRDADIVISATGQPSILDERHITPYHRLVVDCGYVPLGDDRFGDIARSAYSIPQNITPVPGGTGPIEMAVLMERLVRKEIDPSLAAWKLGDYQPICYYTRPELEQLQQQWAIEIFSIANQAMTVLRAQIRALTAHTFRLEGQNYKLTADTKTNLFLIESQSSRGELARFTLTGEVLFASGLNLTDLAHWQRMKSILEQTRNQSNPEDPHQDVER